jgi:hypothetical protein
MKILLFNEKRGERDTCIIEEIENLRYIEH